MSQYCIYRNKSQTKNNYPYLLDIQTELLNTMESRLVIPLSLKKNFNDRLIENLNISILIQKKEYILLTQQMAAIPVGMIGDTVMNCEDQRQEILRCIDFLITGY